MNTPEKPQLTAAEMPARRGEIGTLREHKGKEQETLMLTRSTREDAKRLSLHEDVADLYWEECLPARRMLMNNPQDDTARPLFKAAAIAADAYIEDHNVESRKPRSQLFLGQAAMFEEDFEEAARCFIEGIVLFEKSADASVRENALELRGFLTEALLRSGEIEEGLHEGFDLLSDFDKKEGANLKKDDYYKWAVWKSGVVIKMWNAVLDDKIDLGAQEGKLLVELDGAEEIISVDSEGMLGDFSYRKEEMAQIRKRLAEL